jgi:hypothetical protein
MVSNLIAGLFEESQFMFYILWWLLLCARTKLAILDSSIILSIVTLYFPRELQIRTCYLYGNAWNPDEVEEPVLLNHIIKCDMMNHDRWCEAPCLSYHWPSEFKKNAPMLTRFVELEEVKDFCSIASLKTCESCKCSTTINHEGIQSRYEQYEPQFL